MGAAFAVLVLWVAVVGAKPAAAEGLNASVAGTWAVVIEKSRLECRWRGTVTLVRDGGRLTGTGRASPVQMVRRCPRLKGAIEGTVDGSEVRFGFATGPLGSAEFVGRIAPDGRSMRGNWKARRSEGRWRAQRKKRKR